MSAVKAACLAACVAVAAAAPRTQAQLADAAIKAVLQPKPSLHSLDHRFKLHPSLWNNTDEDWQAFFAKSAALNAKAFPQAPPVQCTPGARELSLSPPGPLAPSLSVARSVLCPCAHAAPAYSSSPLC